MLILGSSPLSLRLPQVVGWFVLCFDCYWLYRAAELSVSVAISFRRVRRVMAVDWRAARLLAVRPAAGRYDELAGLIERGRRADRGAEPAGHVLAARGGRRELRRLMDERREPGAAAASRAGASRCPIRASSGTWP